MKETKLPFASMDHYLYLNREHSMLAEKLAASLREMKADGTWDRLVDSAHRE